MFHWFHSLPIYYRVPSVLTEVEQSITSHSTTRTFKQFNKRRHPCTKEAQVTSNDRIVCGPQEHLLARAGCQSAWYVHITKVLQAQLSLPVLSATRTPITRRNAYVPTLANSAGLLLGISEVPALKLLREGANSKLGRLPKGADLGLLLVGEVEERCEGDDNHPGGQKRV